MENVVFWDMTPCGSCENRSVGGKYPLHHEGEKNQRAKNNGSSYTYRHIAEDGILRNQRRENLRSYEE
jgi:hypothetical protein